MKNLLIAITIAFAFSANAQSVAINTDGSTADPSALLDLKSSNQGILAPRMTAAQRGSIATPATGLMVYQTDSPAGFYFYNGTAWTSLNGTNGQGVPSGGSFGQVLTKSSNSNFSTAWVDPTSSEDATQNNQIQGIQIVQTNTANTINSLNDDVSTISNVNSTQNSQISNLSSRISTNSSNIASLTSTVSSNNTSLSNAITSQGTQITNLSNNLNTTTNAVTALQTKVVPTGGAGGQVLSKIDATDYNTQWITPSAGGTSLPTQTGNTGKILKTDGTDASWASNDTNKEWAGSEVVQFNDLRRILMCGSVVTMVNIIAGSRTTAATFTATEAANWRLVGQADVATIAYPANAVVITNVQWRSNIDGRVWRRSAVSAQVGATQNTTEMANWQAVTEVSRTWTAGAWIENDQIFDTAIGGNAALIRYIGTAKLSTNITGDANNYETISTFNIGGWLANTGYPKHHVISNNGSLYKRLTGGTSAANFAADAANWSVMDGDIKPWQGGMYLRAGQVVSIVMGGVTVFMANINARTTAATLTTAELNNLNYVSQSGIPITYPASQVVCIGFKFSIGQGGNVYRINNVNATTGASFPDSTVQYVPEGSGAAITYTPNNSVAIVSPYTMSIAKSQISDFEFYEDAEMRFAISSNRFNVLSKTAQGVAVWGVEDNELAAQTGLTTTNAPSFVGSYASAGQQPANTFVLRGNVQITTDYDDYGVFYVAPAVSGSFYRISIHGAGGFRNYVIERWRMTSVNSGSKVTLGY